MCSYQPDTLTVRASFSVPSKSGVLSVNENLTDRESRGRHFKMVGKESLLLQKDLSDEQVDKTRNTISGFNGDVSEVRKGTNEHETHKQRNATFDRLVYDTEPPKNESNFFHFSSSH